MARRILVIPVYNEAKTIIQVLQRAWAFVDMLVLVNDGSTDNSVELIEQWAQDKSDVVLISLGKNQGMSGALLTGLAYVVRLGRQGQVSPDDVLITIDADGQHRPEEIPAAAAALAEQQLDVLLGRRDLQGYPWLKRVGNWGLSLWATWLSGFRYYDVECGYRLMRVEVVADLIQFFTGHRYSCAQEIGIITARRGWKVDNRFGTGIDYYRKGTRKRDGIVNLVMGTLAFVRVKLGLRYSLEERLNQVLSKVVYPPDVVAAVRGGVS